MDVDRRFVLKGITLGSIAGMGIGATARAIAANNTDFAADQSLLVLVNEDAAGSAFLHGAMAASGPQLQVQGIACDLHPMLDFDRRLRTGAWVRIIGLLDDAVATLVVDLARGAGARIQWLGQHTAQGRYTRHRLLNANVAGSCSRQLARQLHAYGVGFDIFEEQQGNVDSQHQLSTPPRGSEHMAQWASSIGYLLTSSITQQTSATPAPLRNVMAEGSFVSFSIEV